MIIEGMYHSELDRNDPEYACQWVLEALRLRYGYELIEGAICDAQGKFVALYTPRNAVLLLAGRSIENDPPQHTVTGGDWNRG